jgi:hypothetical protein
MKKAAVYTVIMLMGLAVAGCSKKADKPVANPDEKGKDACCAAAETQGETAAPGTDAAPAAPEVALVPIPLTLPKPMFEGTPSNIDVANLEKPLGKARPAFLAPEGVKNVALNKPVTALEPLPIMGELPMIVDGDKEATDASVVELGPFKQWIVIDLEKEHDIYAIVVWHFHKSPSVYFDVVVQVATDPEFINAVTVYNNDHDNSLGLGVGTDAHYVETSEGRLIDCKGVKGRYVRLWSQGNNQNDYSHYIEVEVFGK